MSRAGSPFSGQKQTDTLGLDIREIYHQRYGLCQLIHYAAGGEWIGFDEKMHVLMANDLNGIPDIERMRLARYVFDEWQTHLQILEPSYCSDQPLSSARTKKSKLG